MTNEIQNDLDKIIKSKKVAPIYPFLKALTHKQRRTLMPTIKKLGKHYGEYIQTRNTWRSRGSKEQTEILNIARFVCATGKEYERHGMSWLEKDTVKNIFEFYIPEWFSTFVNNESLKEGYAPFRMEYDWMMELKNEGILNPSNSLIVKLLPQYLYDSKNKKDSHHVVYTRNDAKLLKHSETLKSHVWLFFEEESNIHWTDHYMNSDSPTKDILSWKQTFKIYADSKQLNRQKLLIASLSTSNMNFNKSSSGWFIDLFETLEPTSKEMLKIQDTMLGVFNSPHSKPTNTVLKLFKKLCLEKGFLIDGFIESTPLLLSSEIKTTVTSTLMILEKLTKIHTKKIDEICNSTTQAFVSNDSNIQTRAAKIIAKFGNPKNENLSESIASYQDLLLTEPLNLLSSFISDAVATDEPFIHPDQEAAFLDILSSENAVKLPKNIDDLMFLASEVFDHNNDLHFDIFPAALIDLNTLVTKQNVDRFEPALQRAYKNVMGDWRSGMGILDHMLSVFFIDYTNMLIERFPKNSVKLKKIRNSYREKEKENRNRFNNNTRHLYPFVNWFGANDSKIYKPFYEKLKFVLKQLKHNSSLPILSTPTHQPHWLDPNILFDRIKMWQAKNTPLGQADLQFAISRTYLKEAYKSASRLETDLKGEPKRILSFLIDKKSLPEGPYKNIAHWYTAAITKNPETNYKEFEKFVYTSKPRAKFTADYDWQVGKTAFENTKWDYKKSKTINFTDYRKMLKINMSPKKKDAKFLESIFKFKISPKSDQSLMIYEEVYLKREWYETSENDIKRFYGMLPNNPENLLAKVCDKTLRYPEIQGETFKRMLINTLETLLTKQQPFGKMAHLLISGALICSDKTARSLSAELWIRAETNELIDSTIIGDIIGQHFDVEFAPLKRFSDLIIDSMIRISPNHDKRLQVLLENVLIRMNESVVRGLKKLLEIYAELLRRNDSRPIGLINTNLDAWTSSKSLSKPILEIKKFADI